MWRIQTDSLLAELFHWHSGMFFQLASKVPTGLGVLRFWNRVAVGRKRFYLQVDRFLEMTHGRNLVFIRGAWIKINSCLLDGPPGTQPGLVPTDACHVPSEQWRGGGTKWDQEPAGEAGVDHEAGGQPVWAADRAQGTGTDHPNTINVEQLLVTYITCNQSSPFMVLQTPPP